MCFFLIYFVTFTLYFYVTLDGWKDLNLDHMMHLIGGSFLVKKLLLLLE